MAIALFVSKIGYLAKTEATAFLRLCFELGINTCTDLRWVGDSNYPMSFRGDTADGRTFVELWEERRFSAVLVQEQQIAAIAPPIDPQQKVVSLGSIAPPNECRRLPGNRRKAQRHFYGLDRRIGSDRRQP